MASYRAHYESIQLAGADVAAIAVDALERSEAVRGQLHLPFAILCDTGHNVVREWGILNAKEKGGIAEPAVFVVDRDRRVRFRSVDLHASRVPTQAVVDFLFAGMQTTLQPARRKLVFPSLMDWLRALGSTFRFGMHCPKS